MKRILLFTAFFLLVLNPARANTTDHTPITTETLLQWTHSLIDTHFPRLNGINLRINDDLNNPEYQLRANFHFMSLFASKTIRKYIIHVNPALLSAPPSEQAIKAILVHEISHIDDYFCATNAGLRRLGLKYAFSKKFHYSLEKEKDRVAVKMGHGEGLIGYRLWQYKNLTPKQLLKKKKIYLTPEQIAEEMNLLNIEQSMIK